MRDIFLDMDGVLTDFDAAMAKAGIKNEWGFIHKPKSEWTPDQFALDALVREQMDREDFWPNLPIMAGAHYLYESAKVLGNVMILTARPNETVNAARVTQQKREWIWKNINPFMHHAEIIVCLRHEKQDFAKYGAILVDDMPINCEHWAQAGGQPILHRSAEETVTKLRSICHE